MNEHIANFFFGVIGGGAVTMAWRLAEKYWFEPRLNEAQSARQKLLLYAQPLSHACHELSLRIKDILADVQNGKSSTCEVLRLSPKEAQSIDWFTKKGYYLTSTAYLFALVSCWIQLYERDVVFLNFGNDNLTTKFFKDIEAFKRKLSSQGSILWLHYVNGIGELLIDADGDRPITLADFTYKLYQDELFRDYYDQLFIFLNQVADGNFLSVLTNTAQQLGDIQNLLGSQKITIIKNP